MSLQLGMQAEMRSYLLAWDERHSPGCLPCAQRKPVNTSACKTTIASAAGVLVYQI